MSRPHVNLQIYGMAAGFIDRLIQMRQYRPLSRRQIEFLCTKGSWLINAELRQAPLDPIMSSTPGESNVYPGQGVSDLNKIQMLMDQYPWGRFAVDTGGPDSFAEYVYIGTNDIIHWRDRFIELWGTVNRPEYFASTVTAIPPQYSYPGTQWP